MLVLRWAYTVWVGIVFVSLMLALLPLFMLYPLAGFRANLWLATLTMQVWFRSFLLLVFIPVRVSNRRQALQARPCIFIANHNSFLDTPIVKSVLGGRFLPLGKREQTKTPILGWIYRFNVVLVDRGDAESRARSMARMQQLLKQNISVFVFPEGRMNRTPHLLASFYDGAFRLALENHVPVCPFVVTNTRNIMPRGRWPIGLPRAVKAVFASPIPTQHLQLDDLPKLKAQSYDAMFQLMRQHAPEATPGYHAEPAPAEPPRPAAPRKRLK